MNLRLDSIRIRLAQFDLEADATLTGRVTALFGDSGAGKTTLLEIIAGLRRPARGTITLDGETLASITPDAPPRNVPPNLRAIGYLPQEGALFPHLDVRRNLTYGSHATTRHFQNRETLTYKHVADILEIGPLADRDPRTLSGGEKQRVALGRALLSQPRILLLDEPLAGLDATLKQRLLPYFMMIRDRFHIPMIYVTHSPDEVMALCDDVLILSKGRIIRHAAPAAIFEQSDIPHFTLSTQTPRRQQAVLHISNKKAAMVEGGHDKNSLL